MRAALPALAALLLAAPASAQSLDDLIKVSSAEDMATAFKAICLDHQGDIDAQSTAATAAPWKLKLAGKSKKFERVYTAWPLQIALNTDKVASACALTSSIPSDSDVAAFVAKASPTIDRGVAKASSDGADWSSRSDAGPTEVSIRVMPVTGGKIATFIVVAPAKPAK